MIMNSEIYEEGSSCFVPTSMQDQALDEDVFSQNVAPNCNASFSMEEPVLSYPQQDAAAAAAAALGLELQQQEMVVDIENSYNPNNNIDTQLMQDPNMSNWENQQEMDYNHYIQIQEMHNNNNNGHHQGFINSDSWSLAETQYSQTPDLLNLLHLPRCSSSLLPSSSISFTNPTHKLGFLGDLPNGSGSVSGPNVLYDPMIHLNLPPQPPLFRELFQGQKYNMAGTRTGTLFSGAEDREANGEFDNGVLTFGSDLNCLAKGREGKDTKHFATERQRRVDLNGKYNALKALIPHPNKSDRASIVEEAITHIKELQRTVNELKGLVDRKRYRFKRHKTEDDSVLEVESSDIKPHGDPDQACNRSSLRSSWLQRKSKNTDVDVRIIDDEVTIKLVQQKRINCLLFVSKVLDELQLDLQHVAGGLIGDFYSFLFNSKIYEGSSVYASAIASKLIDVVDRQYAALQTSSSY